MNKQELKQLIKECIQETLAESLGINYYVNIFNKRLGKIPEEKIMALFDANFVKGLPSITSLLFKKTNKNVEEEVIKSVPLSKVKEDIKRIHLFEDWQFIIRIAENDIEIAILSPKIGDQCQRIIDDVNYPHMKEGACPSVFKTGIHSGG